MQQHRMQEHRQQDFIVSHLLDRPVSVLIATLALVVIGFFSLLRLPVSLLPTLERPRLEVVARDDERSREALLRDVVEPLERRFQSLQGVLDVTSVVDDGLARMTLQTEWQTDVDRLRIDAARRLADADAAGLDELEIRVEAGDRRPIVEIAVLGGVSPHRRTRFADEVLLPELGRQPGAGRLRRFGGAQLRPVLRPNAAALAARGLTTLDLTERLQNLGVSQPAGRLRDGARIRPMILREKVTSLAELRNLSLETTAGRTTIGEIAGVDLEEVPDSSVFRLNGEDAVVVEVHRAPGANAVLLARSVRQAVAALGERSQGFEIVVVRDSSEEVVEALAQLGRAGLLGLILGTLVMRFMLGSWRPTLALVVVVPASLVSAFGGFFLWDVSLDLVSLAGLALAAGMLIDNSVVVLEAIEGARAEPAAGAAGDDAAGEDPVAAGTRQIAMAIVASFLTTAVVFVPLIYLRGLARAFFGVQAFAIVTALLISLVLSLTLTPVLARLVGGSGAAPGKHRASRQRSPGRGLYLALLERALRRPAIVIALTVLILGVGVWLLGAIDRELVPRGTSKMLVVDYRLPVALTPSEVATRVGEVEERLAQAAGSPQSRVTIYRGPADERRIFADEAESGTVELVYATAEELETARAGIVRALGSLPGIEAEVHVRRSAVANALEQSRSRVEVEASASTAARVAGLAERLGKHLETRPSDGEQAERAGESRNWEVVGETGRLRREGTYVLSWKPVRLAQLEAETVPVTRQVQAALGGFQAGRVEMDGVESEILVEATRPVDPRLLPVRPAALNETALNGHSPAVIPLAALASVEQELRPAPFERANGRPALRLALTGDAARTGADLAAVSTALTTLPLALDEGVRLVGSARELQRSFEQLRWALALALLLVFLTVAALYESLAMPLVVMTTVPVAAAGALGTLFLSGQSLNVMSFLALILLAGIVVNNAIVLVHRIEQTGAVLDAARERYRPILMTTVTTLLGMIPLAVLGGEGVELRRALAAAVAGGLLTSLFAALFVVPVLHRALVRRSRADL